MCACKMFHGPGTRRAVCSSIHVNIESKQSATLTLCGMGGALVALTFHYGVVISLDFLLKKRRISLLFPPRTGLPGHYLCHAISTTGATLLLPRPGIGHRTRQDCHLQLPPSFPFPSLHPLVFTSHSSKHWSLVYPHDNRDSCHPLRREVTVTASERRTVRCLDADGPRTHPIVHHTQMKHALKHSKLQLRGDLRHVDTRPAAGLYQGECWMMISLLTRTSAASPTWTASLRIKKCMSDPRI